MIASSGGRNRSFWRSSRGLATASPNADDPPPNRTNRPKRESQIARNQRLAAVFPRNRLLLSPRFARRLNAHAILHGRLVTDEMMINFPDLPYQNVVFMAAAGRIRDFKQTTEPVLRTHRCKDLRFYNLSLHPEAEARDLEVSGAAPIGSLLEWIDDIFETPVTPIDRTLGKWQNVVYAENEFDPIAARRMFFTVSDCGRPIH